jgi:predicted RNA-binding protein with RPS1 domain
MIARNLFLSSFILFFLSSCIFFKKEIKKPVTVFVDDRNFQIELIESAYHLKYMPYCSPVSVKKNFFKGFEDELKYTKNVTVRLNEINDSSKYILVLRKLTVEEKDTYKDVKDGEIEIKGIVLANVTLRIYADLHVKEKEEKIYQLYDIVSKEEEFTNRRDVFDLALGTNKDGKQYRYRKLKDYVIHDLAEKLGERIWVPITRKIAKNQK